MEHPAVWDGSAYQLSGFRLVDPSELIRKNMVYNREIISCEDYEFSVHQDQGGDEYYDYYW